MSQNSPPVRFKKHEQGARPEADVANATATRESNAAKLGAAGVDPTELAAHRRVTYLQYVQRDVGTRARAVGLVAATLPEYIAGLKNMGLIDTAERITHVGAIYRTLGLRGAPLPFAQGGQPAVVGRSLTRRNLWRDVGGDEDTLATAIGALLEQKLIEVDEAGDLITLVG